jgi:1-deoxy-D-xylulose-5-phosphate synthase
MLENIHSPEDIGKLTYPELEQLARELRERIVGVVLRNGGHLASNLGVVEATIALHRVFDSPRDRIIWDVGHQCYAHKLLTGRNGSFDTLRKHGGLCGFPKRAESPHDVFETGHSTTSLSAALGMARARDLMGGDWDVVAFIGDGSLTGGMAFEAMNDAGNSETKIIVVLNDNEMSIARNVGAISHMLARIRTRRTYTRFKKFVQRNLRKIPKIGPWLVERIERLKNAIKYLLVRGVFFEELGFAYIGPIDGHDLHALTVSFRQARQYAKPVVVHISTKKGRGHREAEKFPERFHSFPEDSGLFTGNPKYAHIFGSALAKIAKERKEIVAVTASMTEGCGLAEFRRRYPRRFFDVGIAEPHAVTMAAGLASEGFRPVVAIYSSFLQRAYDQMLHDVCRQRLPVVLAVSHTGLVGEDGDTHQGAFTFSFLSHMPNLTVMAPADGRELEEMLKLALTLDGPSAICYPKGAPELELPPDDGIAQMKWSFAARRENARAVLLAAGERMIRLALAAAEKAGALGLLCDVVNCRFIKPVDEEVLYNALPRYALAMTLEDNVLAGGLGAFLLSRLSGEGRLNGTRIVSMGIGDRFVPQGTVDELLAEEGLTPDNVAKRLVEEAAKR